MKVLMALALISFSAVAAAAEPTAPEAGDVVEYTYSTHLDIAKVISMSETSDVCGVAPATMTYEDHEGKRHTLKYQVMGNGCSNG
jgi:hypothetical protein